MRVVMRVVAAVVMLALVACGGVSGPSAQTASTPPAAFTAGTWELRVDRAWDRASGNVQLPSDPLDESSYKSVTGGPVYRVVVSEAGRQVTVGDTPFAGERASLTSSLVQYNLTTGTFAGGRFVVRTGTRGLEGELTLYGSGAPIAKSERGLLASTK